MATYSDLYNLRNNSDLQNKIRVAVIVKAQQLIDGTPTANQLAWARTAIASPDSVAGELLNYVLAANKASSVAAIQGASDNAIQTNVDAAVDVLSA